MNKELICSSCGSNDMQVVSDDYCVCRHCGTKTILGNKPTNITNNEINLHVSGFDKNAPFYEVNVNKTPDEFLRMALINLATESYTPGDSFDSEFSPVRIVYRNFARIDTDIDISYTVSIGYNKEEKYKDEERVYNNSKSKYEYKTVTKTRTVTEWKPLNGTKSFSYSKGICLDRYDFDINEEINTIERVFPVWVTSQTKKAYTGENDIPLPQMPSQRQIEDIVDSCIYDAARKCKNDLPGDKQKDFSYSARRSKDVKAYVVPQYVLDYKLKNDNYSIRSLAGSERIITGTYPDATKVTYAQATEKTKPLLISTFIALPISILTSLIFLFVSFNGITQSVKIWGFVLCICFCIVAVVLGLYLLNNRKTITNETFALYRQQKISGLSNLLQKLNFAELSSEEIRKIRSGGKVR